MKDWNKVQIGNFIVEKIDMDKMDFIEVRTIGGEWRVMFREDAKLYHILSGMDLNDADMQKALKVFFVNTMSVSSVLDATFQHEVLESICRYAERASNNLSEEEHQKILAEEKAAYEMREEYEREQGK